MTKNTSVRRGLSVLAAACLAVGAAGVTSMPAYAEATSAAEAAMVPVDLTRIVDSREAVGVAKAPENNEVMQIQVTGEVDTVSGTTKAKKTVVPAGASAVVLNMTAVDAKSGGYFTAWKNGDARPSTSNINFMQGDIVANGAVVPLDSSGKISVFARGSADILLDVAGYYRDGTYTASTPSRFFDSRLTADGVVKARSITRVDVGEEGDLVTLNVTVDGAKAGGYITAWPTVEDATTVKTPSIAGMPQTSNLNYATGQTVANTVQVKAGKKGYVSLYSMSETNLIVDKVRGVTKQDCATDNATTAEYCATTLSSPAQRVMDTRVALGSSAKTGYRNLDLLSTASSADNLGSIVLNVTVANPKAPGFIAIGPNLEKNGVSTSVLNYKAGQVMANRVTIPASYAGELQVYSHSETDIIVDVLGYTKTPTLTGADAPANAKLDLSKAKSTTVYKLDDGLDVPILGTTAILLDNMVDGLADMDGNGARTTAGNIDAAGERTFIDGTEATIVDAAGKETKVTLTDHSTDVKNNESFAAAADGKADYKMVPLGDLAAGDYTLRVPLKTDHTDAANVKKGTYETTFTVSKSMGLGAPTGYKTVAQEFNITAPGGGAATTDSVYKVNEKTYTLPHGEAKDAAGWDKNIHDDVDANKPSGVTSATDANNATDKITLTTTAANGKSVTEAPKPSVTTSGTKALAFTPVGSAVKSHWDVATTAGSVEANKLPLVKTALAANKITSYEVPATAVNVTPPQKLEVKLPAAFDNTTKATWMVGKKDVKAAATVPFASSSVTVTAPSRSDFSTAKLPLTQEVTLKLAKGTSDVVVLKIMLK